MNVIRIKELKETLELYTVYKIDIKIDLKFTKERIKNKKQKNKSLKKLGSKDSYHKGKAELIDLKEDFKDTKHLYKELKRAIKVISQVISLIETRAFALAQDENFNNHLIEVINKIKGVKITKPQKQKDTLPPKEEYESEETDSHENTISKQNKRKPWFFGKKIKASGDTEYTNNPSWDKKQPYKKESYSEFKKRYDTQENMQNTKNKGKNLTQEELNSKYYDD